MLQSSSNIKQVEFQLFSSSTEDNSVNIQLFWAVSKSICGLLRGFVLAQVSGNTNHVKKCMNEAHFDSVFSRDECDFFTGFVSQLGDERLFIQESRGVWPQRDGPTLSSHS